MQALLSETTHKVTFTPFSTIDILDPRDRELFEYAVGAVIGGAELPSGLLMPADIEGHLWKIVSPTQARLLPA